MKSLNKLIKGVEKNQLLMGVLFVIYILFDVRTPDILAKLIDTMTGNIVVSIIAIIVFMNTNTILGMLALAVAYILITRSGHTTGSVAKKLYLPSEEQKKDDFVKYNSTEIPIEVEIVKNMEKRPTSVQLPEKQYQPIMGDTHSADVYSS